MARGSSHGILTAEHCFCGGGVVFNNGIGVPIGPAELASTKNLFTDSLFIDANSGARTYDGGVGVGEFSKPAVGTQSNFAGMGVCTSGAATGVHCGIFNDITNVTFTSTCPNEPFVQGMSLAHKGDGTVAAGDGDSGGPVFTLTGPDNSQVEAAGIVSTGSEQTACQGFGTVCFSQIGFTDIDSLKKAHSADVLLEASTTSGGATLISTLVFVGATLLWTLMVLHPRPEPQHEGHPGKMRRHL